MAGDLPEQNPHGIDMMSVTDLTDVCVLLLRQKRALSFASLLPESFACVRPIQRASCGRNSKAMALINAQLFYEKRESVLENLSRKRCWSFL